MADEPTLCTYYRSSCSARVRIALNLKQIPYNAEYISLVQQQQCAPAYKALNPSELVPALRVPDPSTNAPTTLSQSLAIIEYLDERYPGTPCADPRTTASTGTSNDAAAVEIPALLPPPSDPLARARVRQLALMIACDIQPVTNMRVLARVAALSGGGGGDGGDSGDSGKDAAQQWAREMMQQGLQAVEAVLASGVAGTYAVGDCVSLADVCLVPAVWNARRFGVDFGPLPTVARVFARLSELEAVQRAHWAAQEDTPEELRSRAP